MENVVKFEVGKRYYCVSPCNTDAVWVFLCVKVTDKSITLNGEFPSGVRCKRVRVSERQTNILGVVEQVCKPLGGYRLAPTLRAMCTVKKYGKFYE